MLGAEPFTTSRHTFRSDRKEFTDEARQYWLEERGVSLRLSAKVLQAIKVLEAGTLKARFVHGVNRLHAKVFVGAVAATVGSSNFTGYGLSHQFEANARFELPANVGAIKSWSPSPRTSGKPGSPGTPNFVHSWRSYFKLSHGKRLLPERVPNCSRVVGQSGT